VALLDAQLSYTAVDAGFAALTGRPGAAHAGRALADATPELAELMPALRRTLVENVPEQLSIALGGRSLRAELVPLTAPTPEARSLALVIAEPSGQEIEHQLHVSTLMARLSHTFINLPSARIDAAIAAALELVGHELDVDRVFYALFAHEQTRVP